MTSEVCGPSGPIFGVFESSCSETLLAAAAAAAWGRPQNPPSIPQPCERSSVGIMGRKEMLLNEEPGATITHNGEHSL